MMPKLMESIHRANLKKDAEKVKVGSQVRVHVKIKEGDKERIQIFWGTIISRRGFGATETFTVRRVSHGVGVERVFPVHSPHVAKVETEKSGHVRRAKLYYLRRVSGKKARIREEEGSGAASASAS